MGSYPSFVDLILEICFIYRNPLELSCSIIYLFLLFLISTSPLITPLINLYLFYMISRSLLMAEVRYSFLDS